MATMPLHLAGKRLRDEAGEAVGASAVTKHPRIWKQFGVSSLMSQIIHLRTASPRHLCSPAWYQDSQRQQARPGRGGQADGSPQELNSQGNARVP